MTPHFLSIKAQGASYLHGQTGDNRLGTLLMRYRKY